MSPTPDLTPDNIFSLNFSFKRNMTMPTEHPICLLVIISDEQQQEKMEGREGPHLHWILLWPTEQPSGLWRYLQTTDGGTPVPRKRAYHRNWASKCTLQATQLMLK